MNAAGAGGLFEEYDWSGHLIWEYAYDSPTHLAHHDFEVMPNGDLLIVAWELKTQADLTQAGRNPARPNLSVSRQHRRGSARHRGRHGHYRLAVAHL